MRIWSGAQLERNDRHVRRSCLRLRDRTASQRAMFSLSEALRLTSLPGEDQGRVYYFRRVSLRGVPADGDRRLWLEQMQRALAAQAETAIYGGRAGAGATGAVFFHSHEEALELLLCRLFRHEPSAEWFWLAVSGAGAGTNRAERVVAVIERLRELPASWTRVGQVVFAALEPLAVAELAATVPVAAVRRWLRELGDDGADDDRIAGVALSPQTARALRAVEQRFGCEDPRTLWLASLAVMLPAPASCAAGHAVARARATLRRFAAQHHLEPADAAAEPRPAPTSSGAERKADPDSPARIAPAEPFRTRGDPVDVARLVAPPEPHGGGAATHSEAAVGVMTGGTLTEAAGLLFLLNVLTRLGIARALESDPALAEAGFGARVLAGLAAHAGVDANDPLLPWIDIEIARTREAFAALRPRAAAWPALLGPSRRADAGGEYFVRAWTLAVRRYCGRAGRLTVREVVNRRGRVTLSRTDVDVTLALESADIRIRRIGLDIDPGWLPWLGRVVRFHYARAEPGAPPC